MKKLLILLTILPVFLGATGLFLPEAVTSTTNNAPGANTIGDIEYNAGTGDIWITTGSGISRSTDNGESWSTFFPDTGFSAISLLGDWVFAAPSYEVEDPSDENSSLPAGNGFYVSFDRGENFSHVVPDNADGVGQIAYDIALVPSGADTFIYAACFYGGLLVSSDRGESWINYFPEAAESLDYGDLSHRFFSVAADTSVDPPLIWAGSADGLFSGHPGEFAWDWFTYEGHWIPDSILLTDSTIVVDSSWVAESLVVDTTWDIDTTDQYIVTWNLDTLGSGAISGNWIISIDFLYDDASDSTTMFACTRYTSTNNSGPDFDAISFTDNSGRDWSQTGDGYVTWNMGFTGDTLWAASTHGLSRGFPPDYSAMDTVHLAGTDRTSGEFIEIMVDEVVSATLCGSRFFVGTYSEGLLYSDNRGETWTIIATFPDPDSAAAEDPDAGDDDYVYAFPSPYSPKYHKSCFFVFDAGGKSAGAEVEIELYDYDIQKVADIFRGTVDPSDKSRVQWDGILPGGDYPKNGVYYFRVTVNGDERWGKLMIVK